MRMDCHCKRTPCSHLPRAVLKACSFALASVLLLSCFPGCSRKKPEVPAETEAIEEIKRVEDVVLLPASPATGIGRVMPSASREREELVLIDPGHGFDDPGNGDAENSYWLDLPVREREVTMAVSKKLEAELQEQGFRTMMTHDGVNRPEYDWDQNWRFNPDERAAFINYIDPDYMVSIHVNSAASDACGAIVFYNLTSASKWNDWSKPAAEEIADAIDEFVLTSATTRTENETTYLDASHAVTRDTHAAGCLIEMGFATNETDAENMLNEDWQQSMAHAIAVGIARFFDGMEK